MKPIHKNVVRLGSTLLLALSATLTARADYQSTVLSQNPSVYYRLNESVQPKPSLPTNSGTVGSAANGAYVNLPSLNQPGPFAGSVSVGLDGSSSYITVPFVTGMSTYKFTYEMWVNPGVIPKFAYVASDGAINTSPRNGWYFAQDDSSTFGFGSAWVFRSFVNSGTTPGFTVYAGVSPGWTLIDVTWDGANATMYTNGVLAMSIASNPTNFVPNVGSVMSVGIRDSASFPWPGNAAEVALYTNALSPAKIAAHYAAATTAPATYAATVLADAPTLYQRYQAPVQAPAANLGTLGTAGNGLWLSDAAAGAPGPVTPTYPGFDVTNKAAAFDAGGGAVRIPPVNFNTNTITFSGWVNASNVQPAGAGIVVCDSSPTYVGLMIDNNFAGLGLGYIWNGAAGSYGWSPSADSGLPALPDSDWAYVALVVRPDRAEIYLATTNPPGNFTSVTNVFAHVNQSFSGATLVGTDGGAPAFSFNGAIDEVAVWNRSLNAGELYSQYASAVGGLAPIVFSGLTSPDQPIVAGDTLTLSVDAGGTPNLGYTWYLGNIPVAVTTSNIYTKPNFSIANDSGSYSVVVTNLYGSATSAVAVVTGQLATAPVIISGPVGHTLYPGGTLNLKVVATGGGLQYQWKRSNTNLPGATLSSYKVDSVTNGNAGSYTVSVTNSLGATNLGPAVITIITPATNTYAGLIVTAAPEAWWRLDETAGSTNLYDAMGRHDGYYTNLNGTVPPVTLGVAGTLSNNTAASFSASGGIGVIPYSANLNSPKFSYEAWVKTTVINNANLVPFSSTGNGFGLWWQTVPAGFWSPDGASGYRDIYGNGNTQSPIASGTWTHLVMMYDSTRTISGTHYPYTFYINGLGDPYVYGGADAVTANGTGPFIIGGRGTDTNTIADRFFSGVVDEVAVYTRALTTTEITNHYLAGFPASPPSFTTQPVSQNAFVGENVTFSVATVGSLPITLQWKQNGIDIPFQTNSTLTVSNVLFGNTNLYSAVATNGVGFALSANATITVSYPPSFANLTNGLVLHLTFDSNYSDSSGHGNNGTAVGSPALVAGKIGAQAVSISTDTTNHIYNYVTLGTPSDLAFGSNVNFSVAYWVKLATNYLQGDLPVLCSATNSYGGVGLTFAPSYQRGGWSWSIYSTNAGAGLYGPDNSINNGTWHSLVHTFNRNGSGKTFLDGVLVNATSVAGIGIIDSGFPINIGQGGDGQYQESGVITIDDLGVWRRELSEPEARAIYIAGQNGNSFDVPATVSITKSGGIAQINYSGLLYSSGSVSGPWTPVPGATAPSYVIPSSATNIFYTIFGVGK